MNDELWGGDPDTDYPCNFEAEILAVSGISSYLKRPLPGLSPEIVGYPKKLYPQIKKFYPKNLQRCRQSRIRAFQPAAGSTGDNLLDTSISLVHTMFCFQNKLTHLLNPLSFGG